MRKGFCNRWLYMLHLETPTKADFKEWVNMRHALWRYHMKFVLRAEMKDIFAQFEAGTRMVYLAKDGMEYAGFIELSLRETAVACTTSPVGFIEGWFVKEAYRGKGVGKMLVQAGEEWAKKMGCTEMASDTTTRYFPLSPTAHKALGYEVVLQEYKTNHYFYKKLS